MNQGASFHRQRWFALGVAVLVLVAVTSGWLGWKLRAARDKAELDRVVAEIRSEVAARYSANAVGFKELESDDPFVVDNSEDPFAEDPPSEGFLILSTQEALQFESNLRQNNLRLPARIKMRQDSGWPRGPFLNDRDRQALINDLK